MLNHVVAILVLNQSLDVCVQLLQDGVGLLGVAVLQDTLDYSAPIRMCGEIEHLALECIDNELKTTGLNSFNTLLDDVITILVLDTLQHITIEFLQQC